MTTERPFLLDALQKAEETTRKSVLAGLDRRDAAEAEAQRVQRERDRTSAQIEKAVVILYAALYSGDRGQVHDCIEQAISALGFDHQDEGDLSLRVQAFIANEMR